MTADTIDELNPLYQRIDAMRVDELDTLPNGAIQLAPDGTILQFNAYESELSGITRSEAIGKNFFKDVAPCTDVQEFYGRFREGAEARKLFVKFRYHFAFKQNPRNVVVTLFYSDSSKSVWVFVQPLPPP